MKTVLSLFLFSLFITQATNGLAQSGPWAKYDNKMKGEALVREADGGYLEEIKSIVLGGGDVNWQLQPTGLSPLMAAASARHTEVVRFLLEQKADPNLKDAGGRTALDRAKAADAQEIIKLINQYLEKKQTTPAPESKQAAPIENNVPQPLPGNKASGSLAWPPLGTYRAGDSVLFFAGGWKRGTIKEVGIAPDQNNKYAKATENKYLVAPDAYANWPDWIDWSRVTGLQSEPFWTRWFFGDWMLGEVMAINTQKEGAYERNIYSYNAATEALQINAGGTYKWKPIGGKEIAGKWSAASDGPGIVLHKGYRNLEWTIRNESTATERNIRKVDKARLFPSSSSVMQISAKR